MERRCEFPKCGTILCKHNKSRICFPHTRLLEQNNVEYAGGKFYRGYVNQEYFTRTGKRRIRVVKRELHPSALRWIKEIMDANDEKSFVDLATWDLQVGRRP